MLSPRCTCTRGGSRTNPLLSELIGDLSLRDPDFRTWWAAHEVFIRTHGTKSYRHPVVGDMVLDYESLNPNRDPDIALGLHTAEPGSTSWEALRLLAS